MGDVIFLKIKARKGVTRVEKKEKISPRFIKPFKILERIRKITYRLALSPDLASVHNIFHVSMLKKYIFNPSHILDQELIKIYKDLTYKERPIKIIDRQKKKLRNKVIPLVKVQWNNHEQG